MFKELIRGCPKEKFGLWNMIVISSISQIFQWCKQWTKFPTRKGRISSRSMAKVFCLRAKSSSELPGQGRFYM
ncbi:hypothetical protein GOP47_0004256 [Adiantum capillus-veneris]|uniref:Uncharacterized protein n=1 Tax=Adiantum capillus-veneris TaxID=13818 RepID=A0A9D4V7J7_ADICA|nr:hypothetical protein GOP47_0004256 [Adiantum capillus-veneris]